MNEREIKKKSLLAIMENCVMAVVINLYCGLRVIGEEKMIKNC